MQVGRSLRHWPLLPVLAVAALLRLIDLFPTFHHGDEAEYVLVASYLAADPGDLAYPRIEGFASKPFVSQPPLVLYVFAFATQAFGSEHGPLLASVAFGVATVALTYAIGARLRDRWLGAIAALFLAVLPYHVGVSRSAQLDAGLTFFVALAAVAFLHWARTPSWANAFLVGLATAAAALAKLPGLLVVVPMLAVVAGMAARERRLMRQGDPEALARLRALGGSLGIAGVPVLLAGSLYVAFLWSMGATVDLLGKLGWQADRVTGALPTQATERPWHWYFTVEEVGILGQLGPVIALLGVVGFVAVARALATQPRDRRERLFLLVWPLTVLLFFMASDVKQWFYLMPAMPAVALLAAWPLQPAARTASAWLAESADKRRDWSPRVAVAWLVALVVVAAAAPVHATITERIVGQGRFGDGVQDAALWIGAEDPGAAQVGTTLARFTLHLYNGHDTYHYYVNHSFVESRIAAGAVRYVVIDTDLNLTFEQDWLHHLVAGHNGTLVHSIPTPGGDPVRVYRLAPAAHA